MCRGSGSAHDRFEDCAAEPLPDLGENEYEYRMPKSGAESAAEEKLIAGQLQTAAALFNMAFVLRQQGKHEKALELYQRCMRIR